MPLSAHNIFSLIAFMNCERFSVNLVVSFAKTSLETSIHRQSEQLENLLGNIRYQSHFMDIHWINTLHILLAI